MAAIYIVLVEWRPHSWYLVYCTVLVLPARDRRAAGVEVVSIHHLQCPDHMNVLARIPLCQQSCSNSMYGAVLAVGRGTASLRFPAIPQDTTQPQAIRLPGVKEP